MNTDFIMTTPLFVIKKDKVYSLEWQPDILELIQQPRYYGWFSGTDLVRSNAETSLNALCANTSNVNMILNVLNKSVMTDVSINHIVNQCFWELGLI